MKYIPLSGKNGIGKYTLVDDKDFKRFRRQRWYLHSLGYAHNPTVGYLHKLIMVAPRGKEIDHINRTKLDNRRRNLRPATHQQNMWNKKLVKVKTSQYTGVNWNKARHKWRAEIQQKKIGYFTNERHAAMAYDIWALYLFGKFANTNFTPMSN
jgi:hypothetical protein